MEWELTESIGIISGQPIKIWRSGDFEIQRIVLDRTTYYALDWCGREVAQRNTVESAQRVAETFAAVLSGEPGVWVTEEVLQTLVASLDSMRAVDLYGPGINLAIQQLRERMQP